MKKKILIISILLILTFALSGCSEPKMPADVTGIIKTTSYGIEISMKSVEAKLYNDSYEESLDVEFTNDEQDRAKFTTQIDKKGGYDLKVYVTPAYSTTTYTATFENAFIIENGSEKYQSFTIKLNQ